MRRNSIVIACAVAIACACACLVGCQDLFTTSLASSLARPELALPDTLTSDQATDLAAQAKANNDKQLATTLVTTLADQIDKTTDPDQKKKLEAAAASAGITASGASDVVTDVLAKVSSGQPIDEAAAMDIAKKLKDGATPDVVKVLSNLDPATGFDSATSGLSATDYLVAATVVASSVSTTDVAALTEDDKTKLETAVRILEEAKKMASNDETTQSLINSLSGSYNL
jgi:hypothetical protein